MHAGGAEAERLEQFARHLRRVDLRKPDHRHALRTESREQFVQTGAAVLDERAQRKDLAILYIKDAGLDVFVRCHGEAINVVFSCS